MVIALGWCAMRFVGLERVPYGLTTDETLSGLHVICLAQTGATADGQRWPMFATGFAGGLYTPTYLYTLYAWTRVFGASIAAIRGLSAAASIATILGLWLLGRTIADRRTARLAVAAAALSPWSLQVSRFAVDAPSVDVSNAGNSAVGISCSSSGACICSSAPRASAGRRRAASSWPWPPIPIRRSDSSPCS